MTDSDQHWRLTHKILLALILGAMVGLACKLLPASIDQQNFFLTKAFAIIGNIFIALMKMMVVPVVFFSLVTGVCHLKEPARLGRLGFKTIFIYLATTAIAITVAIILASLFKIGAGANLTTTAAYVEKHVPNFSETLVNIFPSNPFAAMVHGHMLQIIVFSLLLGIAMSMSGAAGERLQTSFTDANTVVMRLIHIIISFAPYGVFCLVASLTARIGFGLILHVLGYFVVVLLALVLQLFLVYGLLLAFIAKRNPLEFYRQMYGAMIFAFSTSSSNVSIPVTLSTVEEKLKVDNSIAAFVIPLGATINMDGTAIMQGVATVFIANIYNIHLSLVSFMLVIASATLASIGTAGVPGVGLITLSMVLQQVGLPVEGIGLILGIDRLLDMARTAVNITGDATVACIVAKSESQSSLS